ncbi:MAG: lipocalin family protein [Alphaproteobacteria bacterium]|nr:lipocalin family protein [Alphaproteobacteria bacterium]
MWTARPVIAALAALCLLADPASAAAPQPAKAVDLGSYSGRWYEIARIPNKLQRDCLAPTVDYSLDANRVRAVQRCSAASGRTKVYRSSGRILDPGVNARTRLTFAGFWSQEYWIIDHATDWALVGDPSGRYLWLMSRRATLPAGSRDAALSRMRALGYDTGRLEFAGAGR